MKNLFTLCLSLVFAITAAFSQNPLGNGTDGALIVNEGETRIINSERTTVSGMNFPGTQTILVDSLGGIQTGDEIMIITMTDSTSDRFNNLVGQWETHIVSGTGPTSISIVNTLKNTFLATDGKKHQVIKIPNYTTASISGTVSCPAWDGNTGGILYFKATQTVSINPSGLVSASGKGYRGGTQYGSSHGGGQGGESIVGAGGDGGHYTADPHGKEGAGGGGAAHSGNYNGGNGFAGGGGGAAGGSIGLGSANLGGAGGGGGGHAGSAGGAGYGTPGFGGNSYNNANNGQDGGENTSGNGGYNGTGGGGGGGGSYGSADLSKLFLGSGGGSGGRHSSYNPGLGGNGGGLLYLSANSITCQGNIESNGDNGGNASYYSGGGGGAAGGSIFLEAVNLDISNVVVSEGGNGGSGYYGNNAGDGGDGRIRFNTNNYSNSSNVSPDPYLGQFSNIIHTALGNTNDLSGPYTISASILDNEGQAITSAKLYYRINGGSFTEVEMTGSKSYFDFSGDIPGQAINTVIDYYITASDGTDNYALPSNAPAETMSFTITGFPPYGLNLTDQNDGTVSVNWNAPEDLSNFSHYSVYRSEQENFTPAAFNRIANNLADTAYTDLTSVDFHTYYYVVSANYDFGGTPNESFSGHTNGLLVNNTSQTTVLGYAFLEGSNNHANIKVKFVPQSPSAVADSIYTNALGYFETHNLYPGVYSVRMSKPGYQTPTTMENISIVVDTDLGESILYNMGTTVSGDVSGTWSEFISVNGDITVPMDDTLIIEAGTIVRFLGNYNMFVYGYLASNGTDGSPVLITSGPANQQQAPNQWAGIDFYDAADDNSNLQYTTVEYAYDGIYFEWSSASIDNCVFQFNSRYGINMNRSDGSVINNSTFANNSNSGLHMDYSSSTVYTGEFLSNTSWGVKMYNYSTLYMDACLVENSSSGILSDDQSDLRLTNSTIQNIVNDGIYFYDAYNRGEISQNTFRLNGNGIYLYYRSHPLIHNNLFTENGDGIEIYYDCDGIITENSFIGNANGIYFNSSSHYCEMEISKNIFAYQSNDGIHKTTTGNSYANNPVILNNTIFGNAGDGIHIIRPGIETIRNNIISDNGGYGINAGYFIDTCENNTLYSNALGEISNLANVPAETWNFVSVNPNNNTSCDIYRNINQDPLFRFSDTLDLALTYASKCVNGGSESIIDPDGTISDIGALPFDQGNPHRIYATGYGNQSVSLAWDAVTNDSLIEYNVYYQVAATDSYNLFGSTTQTNMEVTGLTNNTLYDFTVSGSYANSESVYAPKISERPGIPVLNYDPGSFSLLIPAAEDSIIENFTVNNTGSRNLNFNFPAGSSTSAAAHFDGSGDYISMGHQEQLDGLTALSMECWIYRENNGHFGFMGKNYRNYQFAINNDEDVHFYKGYGNTSNQSNQSWDTDQHLDANTWYHLAITWEGNTIKLYINGEFVWETNDAIDEPTPDQYHYSFDIGRRAGENSYYFKGKMAEARVWNIARTADEIKQNLYQSLSGDESGLVGYWPLRENYEDYSTFTANGTAYGETNIQIENNRFALYSVPQPYYTLAPGGTEIIPITFYNRDDAGSLFFTTNLYSDDPVEELVTLEVALQFGETVPATPVHFVPVAESNLPYTIYITDAQIDQQTLDVGDEVGVFDGELCVGAGIFNGDFNFIITAWQDNPGQGLAGFTPGNNMVFKMYDTSADLETNEAEEHYQIGDDTFGLGSFSAVALEASVYNIQNLSITGGQFNLVSFNLLPHYPNADNVFGDLESLQIAYNDDGDVFIPGYNINTIGDINFLDGFYLYTDENTNMEFEGTYIHQEDWQINVEPAKWNYISVLSQDPVAVVDVFTGLEDEVSIVQAASGDSWIPSLGVNTIGNLQPGLGYKIALAVDTMVTFNYPAASKKSSEMPQLASNKPDNTRQNTYFESTPSGLPYAVVVKVKRINEMNHELQLNIGDELGLFAGETCVGSGTFDGTNPMLITAWEMDESQNLPGFSSGQLMYARVYRPSLEKVTRHKLVSEFGSQPRFGLGNFANTTLDLLPYNSNPATFTMAPNPFKSSTDVIIQLNSEEAVDVKIFDPSGRLVKILGNQSSTSAYHKLNWDGTDLKGRKLNPGVYFVIAETSAEVFTEKVIILQ